jgi:hypothetical protein
MPGCQSRHYSKLQPNSRSEKRNACGARNPAPGRKKLLQKNEQREKRDPKHVHHAADEEQCQGGSSGVAAIFDLKSNIQVCKNFRRHRTPRKMG